MELFNKLLNIYHKNCSYCNKPFTKRLWCKECDPRCIIEGWTSGNQDIDKFIKDTIYDARFNHKSKFIEWVPFNRFEDINKVGEGGFAIVYSAIWIDGKANYTEHFDKNWKKEEPKRMKVALKRLIGSQNMSAEFLNELKTHWKLFSEENSLLEFYGITKEPETKEFIMIIQFAEKGSLRSVLSNNFNNILWKEKLIYLYGLISDLKDLHNLGYFHKDFHSGNMLLLSDGSIYISDFGLSGPSNKQKSHDKLCGVLPYIAPEVLIKEPYTLSSDIYSVGVIMAELSSGNPPFHNRKHDESLTLAICNGARPNFGKGTPEIYKKLANRCMDANPNVRPTANELLNMIDFWRWSAIYDEEFQEKEKFGYKAKDIRIIFEEADKEIPNISISYEKDPGATYISRTFTFKDLPKPINYEDIVFHDSQLHDLDVKDIN